MITFCKNIKTTLIKGLINLSNFLGMKKNLPSTRPERFLIISTTGIGDTLWGTPSIRALKETYQKSYVGVLTNSAGFELLKENPNIDNFFIFKKRLSGILSLPFLLISLRQKKFEVAFIFHASDRIIWPLVFLTGAGKIIGVDSSSKSLDFILTDTVSLPNKLHGVEARLALIKQVGAVAKQKAIEIFLTDRDRELAKQLLKEKGFTNNSFLVGLHPGAQKPYKCWPADNFIKLGNEIVRKFKCAVIVTGNDNETGLADIVSSHIDGAISVAGKLTIRETAALIEKMNIFITNDTGPMHIALALKTSTIALFSPTDPKLCGPHKASGKFRVIAKPKICDPCIGKNCATPGCMEQIKVEEVIAEIESLLEN